MAQHALLAQRLSSVTLDLERLVTEIKAALGGGDEGRRLIALEAKPLARAAAALETLIGHQASSTAGLDAVFRLVLSQRTHDKAPPAPSASAQALAMLLEAPERTFDAAEVAERLGCSVPIARTTLNRLVTGGHAVRVSPGKFRARGR